MTPHPDAPLLTVQQPWAGLLVDGRKPFEVRCWSADLARSEGWVWIHAGSRVHPRAGLAEIILCERVDARAMPRSSVVGAVRFGPGLRPDAVDDPWSDIARDLERETGKPHWCWPVLDRVALPSPVDVGGGGLGLWGRGLMARTRPATSVA